MSALIASGRDSNFSGRKLVGKTEESAVRTGIRAKSLLPQEINGYKAADEKKRDGHCDRRKSLPKISRDQMIGELRNKRGMFRVVEESVHRRPDKHVQCADQRDIYQQSRSQRLRMQTHFF